MTKIKRPKNFDPIKPMENNQAAIVSGWKFNSPGSGYNGYLDYTSRQQAVDQDGYHDLLDYTSRKTAVRLDGKNPGSAYSPTFTTQADYLSPKQMRTLQKKLATAEKNKSPLQYGFVSMSTKFLKENNIYQADGTTNQPLIKQAIRDAMAQLMTNEKFGPTAFWWGNIQFDTNHIHVHLGLSELQSTRRKIQRGPHAGEYAGKLNGVSIQRFKSTFTRQLIRLGNTQEQERIRNLQVQIASHRKDLIKKMSPDDQLLQQIFLKLPRDKRKWYASHDQTPAMQAAIKEARTYVQQYLIHEPEFKTFQAELVRESHLNRQLYGQQAKDTAPGKTKKLEDRLINELFKTIRHEDQFQLSVKSLTQQVTPELMADNRLKINELRRQLDQEKLTDTQHRLLKRELITRKVGYKLQNRSLKLAGIQSESDRLQGMLEKDLNASPSLTTGDRAFLAQQQLFLADFEHCLKTNNVGAEAYDDPVNLQVGKVSGATYDRLMKRLEVELRSVDQVHSHSLLKDVYQVPLTKHQIKKSLRAQMKVLKLKRQLNLQAESKLDKRPQYQQLNKLSEQASPTIRAFTQPTRSGEIQEDQLKRLPTRTIRHKLRSHLSGEMKTTISELRRSNAQLERTAQDEQHSLDQRLEAERQEDYEREQEQDREMRR